MTVSLDSSLNIFRVLIVAVTLSNCLYSRFSPTEIFFSCPVYDDISSLDGFLFIFSLEPIEEALLERYGFPEAGTETRCYTNHALSYDQAKRVPRWVIEHLSKQKMLGM